jgi:hypothetical protein
MEPHRLPDRHKHKDPLVTTAIEKVQIQFGLAPLPNDEKEAVQWLLPLVHAADTYALQETDSNHFKRGWYAIGFLYPDLYPHRLRVDVAHISSDAPVPSES